MADGALVGRLGRLPDGTFSGTVLWLVGLHLAKCLLPID